VEVSKQKQKGKICHKKQRQIYKALMLQVHTQKLPIIHVPQVVAKVIQWENGYKQRENKNWK
jgi:hypothetical protein